MSAFSKAVTELIVASTRPLAWDETQDAARAVHAFLPHVAREEVNEALARLREPIRTESIPSAAILALCCGALVEAGGNPQIAVEAVTDRLPEAMAGARRFVEACQRAADHAMHVEGDEEDVIAVERGEPDAAEEAKGYGGDPVADFGDVVREQVPDEANAFHALDPLALGAIAMMSRSPGIRALVRERHPDLLGQALALAPYHGRAGFLATMLRVLDHEPLLALHPGLRRGYELEMFGVATNFELFILLADALIGDPGAGWLPGERPDPRAAVACRSEAVAPGAETTVAPFNVWNWTGLRPDATLPGGDQFAGSEHWVWMEGVPADIRPFEGLRVVLLGPPPYARIIRTGRCFRDMPADLRVTRVLPADEVEDWLRRLSNAPRPQIV
jgi:hypothetical protein